MILDRIQGLLWLLAFLLPFLAVQRAVHREIQAVLLLITRKPGLTVGLFSLLFLPGVFLHETSHYLMAKLLRVPTGRFSLIPSVLPDGTMRLGYVDTAEADFIRDALIGMAPLLAGGTATAAISLGALRIQPALAALSLGQVTAAADWLRALPAQADFWLWFYLLFTVSSTMLPSSSDRKKWLPMFLLILSLTALVAVFGAGNWMLNTAAPWLNGVLQSVAVVFAVSLLVHLALLLPFYLLRRLLNRVTGLRVG